MRSGLATASRIESCLIVARAPSARVSLLNSSELIGATISPQLNLYNYYCTIIIADISATVHKENVTMMESEYSILEILLQDGMLEERTINKRVIINGIC